MQNFDLVFRWTIIGFTAVAFVAAIMCFVTGWRINLQKAGVEKVHEAHRERLSASGRKWRTREENRRRRMLNMGGLFFAVGGVTMIVGTLMGAITW